MRTTPTAAALLAIVAATAAAEPRDDALGVVERWAAAFTASDVAAITDLYAPDATFIGTSSTAVLTGRDAIRGYFERALLVDRPRTATLGERTVVVLSPRAAIVTGTDTVTRVRGGTTISAAGRVTFVVTERDGVWRIVHFHRSAMPAAAPAAALAPRFDGPGATPASGER